MWSQLQGKRLSVPAGTYVLAGAGSTIHVILSPSASSPRLRSGQAGQAPRRIFWVEPPSEILRRLSAPQNDSERRIAQFSYKALLYKIKEHGLAPEL